MGKKKVKEASDSFYSHDWRKGEILYTFNRTRYGIPAGIVRLKVTDFGKIGKALYVNAAYCRKKLNPYENFRYHFYFTPNDRLNYQLFFTKEEAEKAYQKEEENFIKNDRESVYRQMVRELHDLDMIKQRIWGYMRMKIMKKEK